MAGVRLCETSVQGDPLSLTLAGRARVQALEACFERLARTRMAGLPVLNPVLRVQAVGFAPLAGGQGGAHDLAGILITPWFMNLLWLPLRPCTAQGRAGRASVRALGAEVFETLRAGEPGLGAYETCSLFSPMFEFTSQAQAHATACAVLEQLRQGGLDAPDRLAEETVGPAAGGGPSRRDRGANALASSGVSRRGFLLARWRGGP